MCEILVAAVDPVIRTGIARALAGSSYNVRITATAATLWCWLQARKGDLVIVEAALPDEDTFELLPRIKKLRPKLPVIVLSTKAGLASVIRAHQSGAYDYLLTPFDRDQLLKILHRATTNRRILQTKNMATTQTLTWQSPAMRAIDSVLDGLARTDRPVIISGEFGVGKSFSARILHERGKRTGMPFVSFNVATLPPYGVEDEFFGLNGGAGGDNDEWAASHIRQAEGGTLFVQELDSVSITAQNMLARILQRSEPLRVGRLHSSNRHIRLIATTREDPRLLAKAGKLSNDLLSYLNAATVTLPPLRDRAQDIPPVIDYFFDLAFLEGLPRKSMERAALARLMRHRWPGNLREIRNFTRRLAVLCPDEAIGERAVDDELSQQAYFVVGKKDPFGTKPQDLEEASRKAIARVVSRTVGAQLSDCQNACNTAGLYHRIIRDVEDPLIAAALIATRGHQIDAARLLGLSRNTLRKKRR